jgi:hypothetical protein
MIQLRRLACKIFGHFPADWKTTLGIVSATCANCKAPMIWNPGPERWSVDAAAGDLHDAK